jgi:starch phosphorylase
VGRVSLFLLDTNLEGNAAADRELTTGGYGGDDERRLAQEIVLGIGGVHALEAMGLSPTVCHVNEGPAAFVSLERIARFVRERGASFEVASVASSAGTVFTTRDTAPDRDDGLDARAVLRSLAPQRIALGITEEELLDLGRARLADPSSQFSRAVLGVRSADRRCGTDAATARRQWGSLWPDLPEDEVPFTAVADGVHVASWISADLAALLARYLGPGWAAATDDRGLWARVQAIPDAELWQVREHRRHRLAAQLSRATGHDALRGARALTIGTAFAHARALLADHERLARLVGDEERPVHLVVVGGSHPIDPALHDRVVFLEAPDLRLVRALASGVDVWLDDRDTPAAARAAANGALVVTELTDDLAASFFARDGGPLPWAARMKGALASLAPSSSARALKDHVLEHYVPAHLRAAELLAADLVAAVELVAWRQRIRAGWPEVEVVGLGLARRGRDEVRAGDPVEIEARVRLGALGPYDVAVEVYYGPTAGTLAFANGTLGRMRVAAANADGTHTFAFAIPTRESGAHAFAARVLPWNGRLGETRATSLVRWA